MTSLRKSQKVLKDAKQSACFAVGNSITIQKFEFFVGKFKYKDYEKFTNLWEIQGEMIKGILGNIDNQGIQAKSRLS